MFNSDYFLYSMPFLILPLYKKNEASIYFWTLLLIEHPIYMYIFEKACLWWKKSKISLNQSLNSKKCNSYLTNVSTQFPLVKDTTSLATSYVDLESVQCYSPADDRTEFWISFYVMISLVTCILWLTCRTRHSTDSETCTYINMYIIFAKRF